MTRFNLSEWAVNNKSLVVFLMLLCVVGGIGAYERLGRQEDPDFSVQTMVVQVSWPGATAIDTLKQVTDRVRTEARGDAEPRLHQELHEARTGDRLCLSQGIDAEGRDPGHLVPSPQKGERHQGHLTEGRGRALLQR